MSKADKIPPTPPSVVAQITQLPNLPIDALRAIWRKLFHTDAPTHHRRFLERRIAYKLQEIAFRKENRNLLQNNQKRIQRSSATASRSSAARTIARYRARC